MAQVRIQRQLVKVMEGVDRPMSTLEIHAKLKSTWRNVPRTSALARYLSKNERIRRVGINMPATWVLK